MTPTEHELAKAIEVATRKAVSALFEHHPGNFYYISLITSGEAHAPFLVAWSSEALNAAVQLSGYARSDLKWSYADSPYVAYGQEHFEEVRRIFDRRPKLSGGTTAHEWNLEYDSRLRAMEAAMRRLDEDGLFGVGRERDGLVINVEVMPPDYTNTERARRLNPPSALETWMHEAAEKI
jgi:hypothetical protein